MNAVLLVGAGGALGAVARYGVSVAIGRLWFATFPLATLVINIIGSLAMGVVIGLLARHLPPWQNEARLFFAVGVLGGFTTFSSFSLDAITMLERGDVLPAAIYVLVSVIGGFLALWLALLVIRMGVSA